MKQYVDEFKNVKKSKQNDQDIKVQFSPQRAGRSSAQNMIDYDEKEWLDLQNEYGMFVYIFSGLFP